MPDSRRQPPELSLRDLAARARVPARTIRLYIAMGLLPGPLRAGRNAAYGPEHERRLSEIRHLQKEGFTLREIARRLEAPARGARITEPTPWLSFAVSADVVVLVRDGVAPWRMREIRGALGRLHEQFAETPQPTPHEETEDDHRD
jgi:DNA-binding transcriptional MerR regulator